MAFDITSVLKGVSDSDTATNVRRLPLELLDPDPDNFYSLAGIDELADNIAMVGLQQPLLVRPSEEPGRYTIISGHRRRAAIQLLQDGEDDSAHMFDKGVPCIIDNDLLMDPRSPEAKALRELQVIYANSATRVLSAAEISKQAERIEALLYTLKEQGYAFPGRMRNHIAKICQVSQSKIARLHAIRENLVPELLERFDAGQINESVAYRISQEKNSVQACIDWEIESGWETVDTPTIESVIRGIKHRPESKPAAAEAVSMKTDGFNPEAYLQERAEEDENFFWMLKEIADLFIPCLREVPDRREGIETLKRTYKSAGGSYLMGICWTGKPNGLRMVRGVDGFDITRTWTDVYDMLCRIALARAAKPEPKALARKDPPPSPAAGNGLHWSTGTPTEEGIYEMRVGISLEETPQTAMWSRMKWNGNGWEHIGTGAPIATGMTVYRWVKLPEV